MCEATCVLFKKKNYKKLIVLFKKKNYKKLIVLFKKKNYKKLIVLFKKKNYKNQTGWGAGQPGFPCEDGVVGET